MLVSRLRIKLINPEILLDITPAFRSMEREKT